MSKALAHITVGFRKFHDRYFKGTDEENSVYHRLSTEGQTPKTLLIGCSDSRVDPALLMGAEPGDLFVVRNIANLVPPWESPGSGFHGTSSAIEFAVMNLKVQNIIVLGHRQCGGINALLSGATKQELSFVHQWMEIAHEARTKIQTHHAHENFETQWRIAEMESLKISINNLQTFPFVREAVSAGQVSIIGIYFDLELGQLWIFQNESGEFAPVEL